MNTINIEHLSVVVSPLALMALMAKSSEANAPSTAGVDAAGTPAPQTDIGPDRPAREYRALAGGAEAPISDHLKELDELNKSGETGWSEWRLETPHELFGLVDYGHKNANGAYSRDETIKPSWYLTSQQHPEFSGARVVVGFRLGLVDGNGGNGRCLARAVRVARQ